MLKKLRIINFQSHKDTVIQFSDGFNIFQGDSNGGKSSIIRAISAVCYNKWNNESIRVGESESVIELTTDLGVVRLIKNPKQKINTYQCKRFATDEQFRFQSVGTTVPQVVYELTGMRQLNVGDSVTDIPNIMYQLQKHYMLAEVSGKSCTSNLVARIFDKVIGLGGMEQLINDISSSMLSERKSITKYVAQVDQLKSQLIPLQEIQNEQIRVNNIIKLKKQILFLKQQFQKTNLIIEQFKKYNDKLQQLDYKSINFNVEFCQNQMNDIIDLKNKYINASQFLMQKYNHTILLGQIQQTLKRCVIIDKNKIDDIKQLCNKLYLSNKIISSFNDKKQKIHQSDNMIDSLEYVDECCPKISLLKQICNLLYKTNKILQKKDNLCKCLQLTENKLEAISYQRQELNGKLAALKNQCKICPLCGKPFDVCMEKK